MLHLPEVQTHWNNVLLSKTLTHVRPTRNNPIPSVNVAFDDGTVAHIYVVKGVYFEACLINTLRRAQPVSFIRMETDGHGRYSVEVQSHTFPLFVLRAANKDNNTDEFPFVLSETHRD